MLRLDQPELESGLRHFVFRRTQISHEVEQGKDTKHDADGLFCGLPSRTPLRLRFAAGLKL
jgi:hypothetical protein